MKNVKITYILDNPNWTDAEYEDAQEKDREFILTEDMIIDLIRQSVKLENGCYIESVSF